MSSSDIPAAKSNGSGEDGGERQVLAGGAGGEGEQADLAGGIETQPEQHAEREHLPARVDAVAEPLEDAAAHQAAVEQPRFEPLLVEIAAAHVAEDPDHVHEHDQVEDADREQERPRHAGADRSTPVLERGNAGPQGRRGDTDAGGEGEHDARVPEREEEPDPERLLAVLAELARRVVDRGDVVGVERVPQAERVSERAEPDEGGARARVVDEQAPAGEVEGGDRAAEEREATPVHPCTFGKARTVIATPAVRMTAAETAGSARTSSPSKVRPANLRFAKTATRPRPVMESARPSENATMRTRPNASRCSEIAASRTTSADGHGRIPPETPTASRLRREICVIVRMLVVMVVVVVVVVMVRVHAPDAHPQDAQTDGDDEDAGGEVDPRVEGVGHDPLRERERHEPSANTPTVCVTVTIAPSAAASRGVPRLPIEIRGDDRLAVSGRQRVRCAPEERGRERREDHEPAQPSLRDETREAGVGDAIGRLRALSPS